MDDHSHQTDEYSTIDTALMMAGAVFAGNYFEGEVKKLATSLVNIPDWEHAVCDESLTPHGGPDGNTGANCSGV